MRARTQALLVSTLKSGGLLFLPRMFTAGITRQVWLSGSFTTGGGKPRRTQITQDSEGLPVCMHELLNTRVVKVSEVLVL